MCREYFMKKIVIIGAGISGLFFANLLRQSKDYDITIYEMDGTNHKYTKKTRKQKEKKIDDIEECLL